MAIQDYRMTIQPVAAPGPAAQYTPQQNGVNAPPTGLIGSEQALMQGYGNALGGLDYGLAQARGDILSQLGSGLRDYRNATRMGNAAFGAGASALRNAQGDIASARGNVGGLFDRGIGAGNQYFNQGVSPLEGFIPSGQQAQNRQAALSGALGADAQREAMQGFMESPQQAFLREQGERSVTRNAAALGGLGGGNVMKELTRFGTGLAAQDFDNQFNRLGQVSGQGLQAAGQAGQLRGQQGMMNANMRGQQAGLDVNLANMGSNLASSLAGLYQNKAQFGGQMAQGQAGLRQAAGSQLGNQGMQGGLMAGQWGMNTGQNIAQGRTNAGNAIANSLSGLTSNLSNLANQQGAGLSGMIGQNAGNLANILSQSGLTNAQQQQALAQLLSGSAMQGAGYAAGLPGIPGVQQTNGILSQIGNLASGIGGMATGFGWGLPSQAGG